MLSRVGIVSAPWAYYAFTKKYNMCEENKKSPSSPSAPPPSPFGAPSTEEQKTMEELEKLLQDNPYAATDPEEMERLFASKNKSRMKKPPQFSRLTLPLKALTQIESLDGLRLDVSGGLSEKLSLGGSWNFSNTKPSNFTLMAMLIYGANPITGEGGHFINCKKDAVGKMEFMTNSTITKSISFKAEGFFPSGNVDGAHISYEVLKEFSDSHISWKFGGGSYSVGMMQTINSNLLAGFEAMWHPQMRDFIYNYGFKYSNENQTFLGQYIPIAKKDAITLGYINRLSNRLNLFSEFRGSPEGFSESLLGFRLRFNSGVVTGTFNTGFRMTSSILLSLDQMLKATVNTTIDLSKPDSHAIFGIALTFGGGM